MSVRKAGDAGEPPQIIHSKRNRKLALSLLKLASLHSILEHDADLWDRAFSGTVLFVTCKNALPLCTFTVAVTSGNTGGGAIGVLNCCLKLSPTDSLPKMALQKPVSQTGLATS